MKFCYPFSIKCSSRWAQTDSCFKLNLHITAILQISFDESWMIQEKSIKCIVLLFLLSLFLSACSRIATDCWKVEGESWKVSISVLNRCSWKVQRNYCLQMGLDLRFSQEYKFWANTIWVIIHSKEMVASGWGHRKLLAESRSSCIPKVIDSTLSLANYYFPGLTVFAIFQSHCFICAFAYRFNLQSFSFSPLLYTSKKANIVLFGWKVTSYWKSEAKQNLTSKEDISPLLFLENYSKCISSYKNQEYFLSHV